MTVSTIYEHSLLATFILPIAQALRVRGIDAMAVIEDAGIDPAGVINPDRRITATMMQKRMHSCVALTGERCDLVS